MEDLSLKVLKSDASQVRVNLRLDPPHLAITELHVAHVLGHFTKASRDKLRVLQKYVSEALVDIFLLGVLRAWQNWDLF
jgi:hypothetical protein